MAIVVIGAVFVDIKGYPHDKYIPDGRNAGDVLTIHGGVGRNVAEDIANVGLYPKFVSLVDDNAQGEEVVKRLRNRKVNTDYVLPTKDGMGVWLAVFNERGDVAASISKRPDPSEIARLIEEKGDEIFADCDSIVIEVCLNAEIVKSVLRFAEKYGKKVYGVVANMSIAIRRRDLIKSLGCFVCNLEEAELLFADSLTDLSIEELCDTLSENVRNARIPSMVMTLGCRGSVYASMDGEKGYCPAEKVVVRDTTGAGDAFCAGVSVGLTYGKSLSEAVKIGTRLAASVVTSPENTCPRFLPQELGLNKLFTGTR